MNWTWAKLFTVWLFLFAAGYGWSMGTVLARWTRRAVMRRLRRWFTPRVPNPKAALRDLIGMVDQMDRPPSAGGGVFPIDKARVMHAAREAAK